jgi:hypothetical protein
VARIVGIERYTFRVLLGKRERKMPLAETRCRWKGNIKMDLKEIGWE